MTNRLEKRSLQSIPQHLHCLFQLVVPFFSLGFNVRSISIISLHGNGTFGRFLWKRNGSQDDDDIIKTWLKSLRGQYKDMGKIFLTLVAKESLLLTYHLVNVRSRLYIWIWHGVMVSVLLLFGLWSFTLNALGLGLERKRWEVIILFYVSHSVLVGQQLQQKILITYTRQALTNDSSY